MSVSISEFSPKSGFEIRNPENLHGCSERAVLPSDSRVRHMRLTVSGSGSQNPSLSGFRIRIPHHSESGFGIRISNPENTSLCARNAVHT